MSTLKLILKTILYRPLFNALIFLVWLIPGNNVGWAIIILTIIIRLILIPSSLKASRAQIKLRDLQPEIQKIQEQYKNDRQRQSKELMEFYRQKKVSPWGSCLPLLIQFPILIILYYVFINGLGTHRYDLLYSFTPRPEEIKTVFLGIDLAKPDRWILPIITGALQFIQGWQITPKTKAFKGQEMQTMMSRQMLYLMPILTIFIAMRLPAALPLYWAITTLFGIGQQWYAVRQIQNSKFKMRNEREDKENKNGYRPIEKAETLEKTTKHGVEVTVRKKK